MTKRATVLVVVAVLAAVFASLAFAGGNSSSSATYNSKGTKVQRTLSKPKKTKRPSSVTHPSVSKGGGTLPFTGLDLAFIAGGGVLLVAMGGSLRRLTRKPPAA